MNEKLDILDVMNALSFFISIANYSENLDQTSAQKLFDNALKDIHHHLKEQDDKIDKILERIEKNV